MGLDGGGLSCPGSSVVAEEGEQRTLPFLAGLSLLT